MKTINLRELYEEVGRVLDGPENVFCVTLKAWHYGTADDPTIVVNIWDGRAHYEAGTPKEALAAFRAAHPSDVLAAVEAVEVPEAGG